jgi:3-oxoacyl-[acyl-carrier-protein] synthase III
MERNVGKHHANTSAASVPLALVEAAKDGRIKRGNLVLLGAMGEGLRGRRRWCGGDINQKHNGV